MVPKVHPPYRTLGPLITHISPVDRPWVTWWSLRTSLWAPRGSLAGSPMALPWVYCTGPWIIANESSVGRPWAAHGLAIECFLR